MQWLHDLMLPTQGSSHAPNVDGLFMFVFWLCVIFFVGIVVPIGYFAVKYKRRGPNDRVSQVTHNTPLEIAWSVGPLLLLLIVFFWGFKDYMTASVTPGEAMEINVTGEKWIWTFEYPNGMKMIGKLYVPVNKPIKLVQISKDVLHSFYIPAFRIKADVLPNRYTEQWFVAEKPGKYQVQCAEYCGKGHSQMNAEIEVLTPAQYEDYLENGSPEERAMPPAQLGKVLYESRGCVTCHSLDGSRGQGPSWKGIYGDEHKMTDGRAMKVDENYIRTSILQPQAMIVQGYEGIMPTYQGLLRDREITALIAFIKEQK